MKKLGDLISPLVREFGMEEAVRFEEIRKDWGDLFNEPLSLHMFPSHLQKGELLINVDSPLWLQQLTFLKAQIIKNLARFGIKDVRFRIGKVAAPRNRKAQPLHPASPALRSDSLRQIEDTVEKIDDSVIKESIRKAMGKALSSRKTR